jgi:hypothetical protein
LGKGQLIALVVPPDFPVHLLVTAPARDSHKPERSAVGYFMNLLQQIGSHLSACRSTGAGNVPAWAVASTEYEIVP